MTYTETYDAMRAQVTASLSVCCEELVAMHATGVLPDGVVRQIRAGFAEKIKEFGIEPCRSLSMIEREIEKQALEFVVLATRKSPVLN